MSSETQHGREHAQGGEVSIDKWTNAFGAEARAIVEAGVKRLEEEKAQPITGKATSLACRCGGVLHERELPEAPSYGKPPRVSRNRRIARKQIKRWFEETRHARMMGLMLRAARPMGYRCATCKTITGIYEAIGRNAFKIEPMPQGALLTYEKDIDVASIVLGDEDGKR